MGPPEEELRRERQEEAPSVIAARARCKKRKIPRTSCERLQTRLNLMDGFSTSYAQGHASGPGQLRVHLFRAQPRLRGDPARAITAFKYFSTACCAWKHAVS
jgi:hypothetical protein